MTDDVAALKAARQKAADAYDRRLFSEVQPKLGSADAVGFLSHILDADEQYIAALEADRDHWQQRALAAEGALKPFALTDDEQLELTFFLDEDRVFLRPDDGNDSVKRGWSKKVTIGDMRRASEIMPDIE